MKSKLVYPNFSLGTKTHEARSKIGLAFESPPSLF